MTYNFAQHIAWDILSLVLKPMSDDIAASILRHIHESGADESEINAAVHIVEHLNDIWNT